MGPSLPHWIRKLSVMKRIWVILDRVKTRKVKEDKCELGKLLSVPASATKLVCEKGQIT